MSISEWLKSIGYAQYVRAFLKNDMNVDALAIASCGDLEKIVQPLGHRIKILRACDLLLGSDV